MNAELGGVLSKMKYLYLHIEHYANVRFASMNGSGSENHSFRIYIYLA